MTAEYVIRFFMQRPFEAFTMVLTDGREIHIPHREFAEIEQYAVTVLVVLPTRQVEVVDTSLIVSLRTIYASDPAAWSSERHAP